MTWFKQSEQVILDVLLALWFILDDLQNNHISLMTYVQAMIQNRRNTNLFMLNQLLLTWNKLNSKLQHDVLQLRYDMMMISFIEQLEKHKDIWKCLFSQSSYWYEQWGYELQPWSQSSSYNFADNDQQPCHFNYLSNNVSENAANWDYKTNNQGYKMNNWDYEAQQLNHTPSYDFISNNWQLCCPEYLNDQWNKSQFKH